MSLQHAEYTRLVSAMRHDARVRASQRASAKLEAEAYAGHDAVVRDTLAILCAIGRLGSEAVS